MHGPLVERLIDGLKRVARASGVADAARRGHRQLRTLRVPHTRLTFPASRTPSAVALPSFAAYQAFRHEAADALEARRALERELEIQPHPLVLHGVDPLAGGRTSYYLDSAMRRPDGRINLRETLQDVRHGFQSRIRATLLGLTDIAGRDRLAGMRIYLTEQVTPLFRYCARRFGEVEGSEYLGPGKEPGSFWRGLRHEDLTALSFRDNSFDGLVTLEVLEHIPDYRRALREMWRVIRPGGFALVTVPFQCDREEHLERAQLEPDGRLTHFLPPEYHGDPVNRDGILSFRTFGWRLLDDLRAAGFTSADAQLRWDVDAAILGEIVLVSARK